VMPDDRARVPFAIVGVVLLLGSATFAASTLPERPAATPGVETAMDRAGSETRTAIRHAVRRAGDAAARNPVVVPANTAAGSVLDSNATFRDALRIRVYLRARERVSELAVRQGDVAVSASLPPTPNASALERAVGRVELERVGENGTAVEATVENVSLVARRGGRTVARRTTSPTVVVRTPVLELHDSVGTFERRLNRNVTKPGLAQGLTARLLQVAWIRGYAQYGGGGLIDNVVDSGHVELTTNQAILAEQRHVFGRSDAEGRRALRRATARVALSDLFSPWGRYPKQWVDLVLRGGPVGRNDTTTIPRFETRANAPEPNAQREVTVGPAADRALGDFVASDNVSQVLRSAYSANVRLRNRTRIVDGHWPPPPPEPAGSWQPDGEHTRWNEVEVTGRLEPRAASAVGDWHTLDSHSFRVETNVTRVQEWVDGNAVNRTTETATPTYRVDLRVEGKHAPTPTAPTRGVATVHERGEGPFDGPNLAGVERNATEALLADNGGPAAVAEAIVSEPPGEAIPERNTTVAGARPDGLRAAVLTNLTGFRSRVRNVSTRVQRDRLATMQANPAGDLAITLRDRHDELIEAPSTYGSVGEKARLAVRGAYLDRVRARLNEQRSRHRAASDELEDALTDANAGSKRLLENAMGNRTRARGREATGRTDDGTRITAVNGAPPYLTVGQVGHEQVPAIPEGTTVHPLAARNVNAFTLPYADIADALFGALLGSTKTTSLGHAASVLQASTRVDGNESVAESRSELRRAVRRKVGRVEWRLAMVLEDEGLGRDWEERNRTIAAGLSRWDTPAAEALALSNESAVEPITRAAASRYGLNETESAVLRGRLAAELQAALERNQVSRGRVNPLAGPTRQWLKHRTGEAVDGAMRRAGGSVLDRLDGQLRERLNDDIAGRLGGRTTNRVPAGLPLQPIGTWYTTINAWHVEVRGAYPRFAVSARRGGPDGTDGTLTYVREREPVRLDFDGDGQRELFGRNERVAFAVRTSVGVAVPPGPPGVGDTNGNMDERSAGWAEWTAGANGSAPPGWPPD
jgi:hypothetical protein